MVFVSTKAGFVDDATAKKLLEQGAVRKADVAGGHCLHPACLKASVATSLERLQLHTVQPQLGLSH
jgi:aryl-alcohol dehydrogenase-like predicted oxidoreductase